MDTACIQTGLKEDFRVTIAESIQLPMEKGHFRGEDNRSNKEKEESLKYRQKAAQNAQNDKRPSQEMPEYFFLKCFFHLIEGEPVFKTIISFGETTACF